jgi:hypothetical protein
MNAVCLSLALLATLPCSSVLLDAQEVPPPAAVGPEVASGQSEDNTQSTQAPVVLTGLGSASQGSLSAERDQLVPEFRVLETVESNPNELPDVTSVRSITRILGTVGVERVRNFTDLKLAYVGGAELFNDANEQADQNRQLQELYFDAKLKWKRTDLRFVNAFSYLPEAPFGAGSFGGVGVFQSLLDGYLSGLAGSGLFQFSPAQFASIGNSPRLINTSVVELVHRVTPRAVLTATAAYGFVNFLENAPETPPLENGSQGIGEVGYNYAVGPKDTAAVLGGYGSFEFSHIGQAFTTVFTELFWGHQFSPRTTLSGGAGPVIVDVKESGGSQQLTWMAVARLRYERPRTALNLRYLHYINGGSGLLLGAHSDVGTVEVSRQLSRTWNGLVHAGIAHSTQIEGVTLPGFTASSNNNFYRGYAGVRFSRPLTEHTEFFVFYNYSQANLSENPSCGTGQCGRVVQQNIGGVGFTWAPRPIRLP